MKGPHSYRDFIDPSQPMYVSDEDILSILTDGEHHSPHSIADSRLRENVIRLQLRDLETLDAVVETAHESFRITSAGKEILESSDLNDGMVPREVIDSKYPPENQRLCNFTPIDASDVKGTNQDIRESGSTYGWVQGDRELTEQRISNVIDADIRRIIREFPTYAPLPAACAHWVRSLVGLHLFPDANHRTATNTLEYVLLETGLPEDRVVQPNIARFVLHSKYIRTFQADVRFNTLWERDELFQLWFRYFSQSFTGCLERRRPNDPPTIALNTILENARLHLQRGRTDAEND